MANIPQPPVVQGLGGCRAKHSRTSHNETLFPLTSTLKNCTLTQLSLNTAAKGEGNREKTVRHEQKREVFSLHFKPRQAGKEKCCATAGCRTGLCRAVYSVSSCKKSHLQQQTLLSSNEIHLPCPTEILMSYDVG